MGRLPTYLPTSRKIHTLYSNCCAIDNNDGFVIHGIYWYKGLYCERSALGTRAYTQGYGMALALVQEMVLAGLSDLYAY